MQKKDVDREYKNPEHITEQEVLTMLKSAAAGVLDDGQYIPIRRHTPIILHEAIKEASWQLGLSDSEVKKTESRCMIMQVYKARQAQAPETEQFRTSRGHDLTAKQIVGIINKMAKPDYVGYQDKNDRFFEVVHYGKKDKRIDVAVFFDVNQYESPNQVSGYKSNDMKYDVVVTLFSLNKEEKRGLIKNSYIIILQKQKGVLQLTSGKNLPPVLNDTPFYKNSIPDSSEKSNNPGGKKSVDDTIADDREYMAAVERGDMETAQRMLNVFLNICFNNLRQYRTIHMCGIALSQIILLKNTFVI